MPPVLLGGAQPKSLQALADSQRIALPMPANSPVGKPQVAPVLTATVVPSAMVIVVAVKLPVAW